MIHYDFEKKYFKKMIKIALKVKRNQGRDRDRTFNLLSDMDLDINNLFYSFVPYWQVLFCIRN